jgi:hypothetical protein
VFGLAQCLRLDLLDALAGDRELLADLLASTRVVVSRRLAWIAASSGNTAFLSSMKSPRCESSSLPIAPSCSLAFATPNL